jgi:hypothetical protein
MKIFGIKNALSLGSYCKLNRRPPDIPLVDIASLDLKTFNSVVRMTKNFQDDCLPSPKPGGYKEPKCGEGVAGSQPMSAAVHIT